MLFTLFLKSVVHTLAEKGRHTIFYNGRLLSLSGFWGFSFVSYSFHFFSYPLLKENPLLLLRWIL